MAEISFLRTPIIPFLLKSEQLFKIFLPSQNLIETLSEPAIIQNCFAILENPYMSFFVTKINTKINRQRLVNQTLVVKCSKLHNRLRN